MNHSNSNDPVWLRFSDTKVALKYPSEFRKGLRRDEREKSCILKTLRFFPKGSHILDLPCGSGRLTKMLLAAGYTVTAADISKEMLQLAEKNCRAYQSDSKNVPQLPVFKQVDVLDTGFKDNEFDGVICYRLFHHFLDAEIRKKAIAELHRISRGSVIVSFFNSFSLSASMRRAKYFFKGQTINDRVAIKMNLFLNELRSQGLKPIGKIPVQWGVSPKWNVVAMPLGVPSSYS